MKNPILLSMVLLFSAFKVKAQQTQSAVILAKHPTRIDSSDKKNKVLYGTASFYADKFNGRQTSNGEIYSHSKYTAACNILPLGTWIRVTNLRNRKSVILKVNDRLHPKNPRLVDLSKVAAQTLGYVGRGLTQVKVEPLVKKAALAARERL